MSPSHLLTHSFTSGLAGWVDVTFIDCGLVFDLGNVAEFCIFFFIVIHTQPRVIFSLECRDDDYEDTTTTEGGMVAFGLA